MTLSRALIAGAIAALLALAACGAEQADGPRDTAPPYAADDPPTRPPDPLAPEVPPDPDAFLPPLDGYITDDDAEPGELESSLDHGAVPYVAVRRRLILDEQGFTSGEVTVVTVEAGSDGVERYLAHRFGDARRTPIELAGEDLLRIEAEPHGVIAWTGPTFAVTFQRGQARSEAWLQDLARATITQSGGCASAQGKR